MLSASWRMKLKDYATHSVRARKLEAAIFGGEMLQMGEMEKIELAYGIHWGSGWAPSFDSE